MTLWNPGQQLKTKRKHVWVAAPAAPCCTSLSLRSTTTEPRCDFKRDYFQTFTYPNESSGPVEPLSQTNLRGCPVWTHDVWLCAHAGRGDYICGTRTAALDDAKHNQLLTRGVSHVSHPLFRKARTEKPPPPPPPSPPAVECVRTAQPATSCCCTTAARRK